MTTANTIGAAALAILVGGMGLATGCGGSSEGSPSGGVNNTGTVPSLSTLDVSGASGGLVPPFSPGVHDYYVRCAAGPNALTISMTASRGAESALTAPAKSLSKPRQIVTVNVREDEALVATATSGAATTEYWVRCLPHDFPQLEMVAHPEAGTPTPGYYLVGNRTLVGAVGSYAMVLDGNGVPVWYFREPQTQGVFNVDSEAKGAISFTSHGTSNPFPYEVHQLDPWKTTYPNGMIGPGRDEHELRALPNGDYLVIAHPLVTGVDLTGIKADGVTLGSSSNMQNCDVIEVDPKGKTVWKWMASDHIDPVKETTFLTLTGSVAAPDGGPVLDPFHCNSIDIDPANGNLLVSSRQTDSVVYLDKSTGTILWKMGGTAYSKDHARHVPVSDPFFRQHDARLLPGWNAGCHGGTGRLSVFDDETGQSNPARAVIYDVVVGGDGTDCGKDMGSATRTAVEWQYSGPMASDLMGSFRILPDGSRVIGWGSIAGTTLAFTEVDERGDDLLDFHFTDGNTTYRAIKTPLATFDLDVLRRTAGRSGDVVAEVDAAKDGKDAGARDASP